MKNKVQKNVSATIHCHLPTVVLHRAPPCCILLMHAGKQMCWFAYILLVSITANSCQTVKRFVIQYLNCCWVWTHLLGNTYDLLYIYYYKWRLQNLCCLSGYAMCQKHLQQRLPSLCEGVNVTFFLNSLTLTLFKTILCFVIARIDIKINYKAATNNYIHSRIICRFFVD